MYFNRYKITQCAATRELYSLLRSTKISAKVVWLIRMLINKQTRFEFMGNMSAAEWTNGPRRDQCGCKEK
jgi:hypothetical protein